MTLILTAFESYDDNGFDIGVSGTFCFSTISENMRTNFPYISPKSKTLISVGRQTFYVAQDFQTVANYLDAKNLTND